MRRKIRYRCARDRESSKYLITKDIRIQHIRRKHFSGPADNYVDIPAVRAGNNFESASLSVQGEGILVWRMIVRSRQKNTRDKEKRRKEEGNNPCKPVWPLTVADIEVDSRFRRIETCSQAKPFAPFQPFCSCRLVH